jgi:two-component system, OmpR family, response regulator
MYDTQADSQPLLHTIDMSRTLKVLLVEDSKVLTERLSEVISQTTDVDLIGAVDNENDAVSRVRRDPVDVMILDLHLKQGTGFGVLRALAKSATRPKVIILTNYDLPEYKSAAMALGARYFLDKARDYDRIPEVLSEICIDQRAVR